MIVKRGDVLRILPQLGDTVCLEVAEGRAIVAVPTYGERGLKGYEKQSVKLDAFTIGKRESVSPDGSDEKVFQRAVDARYLNQQLVFD